MTYNYSPVHAIVNCDDCGWKTYSYKNAQALAAIHARAHGHRVLGELAIAFHYDARADGPRISARKKKPVSA
jgi:hypothetical protein